VNPLTLNDAERQALADAGVTADSSGALRSGDGSPVSPGVAAALLKADAARHPDTGQFIEAASARQTAPNTTGIPEPGPSARPGEFDRGYLEAGHAAESPAVTGRLMPVPHPETHPAEPQDYHRGPLDSTLAPDSDPEGNNPHPPGGPARDVLDTAGEQYEAGRARSQADRLLDGLGGLSGPAVSRAVMPPDLRASSVPFDVTPEATRAAPGEDRTRRE